MFAFGNQVDRLAIDFCSEIQAIGINFAGDGLAILRQFNEAGLRVVSDHDADVGHKALVPGDEPVFFRVQFSVGSEGGKLTGEDIGGNGGQGHEEGRLARAPSAGR